jgi:hypothetical protein
VGVRCADHVTPSTRKSRHYFADSGGRSVGIVRLRTKATELNAELLKLLSCLVSYYVNAAHYICFNSMYQWYFTTVFTRLYNLSPCCDFLFCYFIHFCTGLPATEQSHHGSSGLISGQAMWDFWWTKWHWGRFSPSTSVSPANSRSTDRTILIYYLGLEEWAHQWPVYQVDSVSTHPKQPLNKGSFLLLDTHLSHCSVISRESVFYVPWVGWCDSKLVMFWWQWQRITQMQKWQTCISHTLGQMAVWEKHTVLIENSSLVVGSRKGVCWVGLSAFQRQWGTCMKIHRPKEAVLSEYP